MKILFFSHYFPPEVNAPASRTYDHAVRWVKAGHQVSVITCNPNCPDGVIFPGYKNSVRQQTETQAGVRVVRTWTYLAPNAGSLKRILNYLSYMISAIWAGLWQPRPTVVVATSPQFFCAWAGWFVAFVKRVPFVVEIRDIWPESIEAVGAMRFRPVLRVLEAMERRLYRWADWVVTVGSGYKDRILQKANVDDRISVIMNGVDPQLFKPLPKDSEVQRQFGLEGKFVCSYVGTIGMAHGLEVTIASAQRLKEQGRHDIVFLLVGDGAQRENLQQRAAEAGVADLVIFTGRQPKAMMPKLLAASDVCLVHLRKCELFESVVPSKIFETMAMQRPILMAVRGEARQIVLQAKAGLELEPDDPVALTEAVTSLADQPALTRRLGQSAREFVLRNYNRDVLADRYLHLLMDLTATPAVVPLPTVQPAAAEGPNRQAA